MKQFGDTVQFNRHDGKTLNGLVIDSRMVHGAEHLHLAYLDPVTGPLKFKTQKTMEEAFDVAPLSEKNTRGWFEGEAPTAAEQKAEKPHTALTYEQTNAKLLEQIKKGGPLEVPDGANLGDYFKALNERLRPEGDGRNAPAGEFGGHPGSEHPEGGSYAPGTAQMHEQHPSEGAVAQAHASDPHEAKTAEHEIPHAEETPHTEHEEHEKAS